MVPQEAITVEVETPPLVTSQQAIREGLSAYNRSKTPSDYSQVQVVIRDGTGAVRGGAVGYVGWGELYVDLLWIDESLRGQGLGTRVMALVEEEARTRRCHRIHLGTMSHQAPDFYARIGYLQYAYMPGANGWPDRYLFYKDVSS